jgi:small conductance mechanosensitive channel
MLLQLGDQIALFAGLLADTAQQMADLPALWGGVMALWHDGDARGRLMDALFHLGLLAAAGTVVELLAWRLLRRLSRRLDRMAPPDGDVWTWLRRVPLVIGRLGLDLVPLLVLSAVVTVLLGVLRPAVVSSFVVLMALHVYLAARLVLALARMLLSPASGHMRLLPVSDATAAYLIIWLRRMLLAGLGGYALAETALLVGMPLAMHAALLRLGLVVITMMLLRMIRQQQARVAALLAPPPLPDAEEAAVVRRDSARQLLRAARARLAANWHLLAILWLLAVWMVGMVGVERGFAKLLRASGLTLLLVLVAKLADEAVRRGFRWLRHPPEPVARWAPWLKRVTATYLPPLEMGWTLVLLATCLVMLAEIWGYGSLKFFNPGHLGHKLLGTALSIGFTLAVGLMMWEAANGAIERHLTRDPPPGAKHVSSTRLRTLLPVLRAFLATGVFAFIVFNVLQELGVNIGPLIAGAGVIGLAIGFGSQKLVQDVITGIFLLVEDSVAVGDVVSLGDRTGVVEHLTIRSIKLRALDGSIHWVPFSAVTTVTNMTRDFGYAVVDVTVGFQEDPDKVIGAMRAIAERMRAEPEWGERMTGEVEAAGMEKMTDMGMVFRVRARTAPGDRWLVARELNRRCRMELELAGIELPPPAPRLNVETPLNPMESASVGM